MTDRNRPDYQSHPNFVATHQLSRRQLLQLSGAAGGAMLVGGLAPSFARQASAQDGTPAAPSETITGGPIEVGVLYEEGAWFEHAKSIGDSLQNDYPNTEVKYTFANTASDPARALRWQNGDPLDTDTGRWSNQAPPTWDWVNNGFVLDMSPYVNAPLASGEIWGDTFTQGAKSFSIDSRADTTTPGVWWGVPYESVLMLMHYNVQIFEDLGITPPTTWAEFLTVCETINTQGADKGIKPICVSGPTNAYCAHWWDRMAQRVVGREAVDAVLYGDAKVADNPGFLTAAQEIGKLPANGWFMEGFQGADFTGAQALFFQGKAAMIHMGSWLAAEMADVIPEGFRLGVFDFPTYDGGAGDQGAMFGTAQIWSIANPEKSTSHEVNVPLAVEYLRRWTSKERETERSDTLRMIPTVVDVPAPTGTTGMPEMVEKSATADVIIYYYAAHWDTGLSTAWWNPVQALFLGQASPEEMIAMLDKNLDEYRQLKQAGA
jgi:raffinose/stachyose/melibiose transport system substrate-binding protein